MRCGLLVLSNEVAVMRVSEARNSCSSCMLTGAQAIIVATGLDWMISWPLATV